MSWHPSGRAVIFVLTLLLAALVAPARAQEAPSPRQDDPEAQEPPDAFTDSIEVVAVTPIHGLGIARDKVPVNVLGAGANDIARLPGAQVTDVLEARAASVRLGGAQAGAFQPDLQFRGFTASPLLGLAQGVAIYQDGVRINEPFGDTINWDLLPANAIASVNLTPGSNPLFGLNALGGALSIETKTGFSSPGHDASFHAGAFGRVWTDASSGGHSDRLAYFVAGRLMSEDGWRDHSPSTIRQLFGSVEWRTPSSALGARVSTGANTLIGNGPAPVQLVAIDRAAVFTHPDETRTRAAIVSGTARHAFSPAVQLDALAYYRPATVHTFNGDDTNYEACDDNDDLDGVLCLDDDDEPVRDQLGRLIPAGPVPLDATNNTSSTRSHGWGLGAQVTATSPVRSLGNHFIAGLSLDAGRSRYEAATELARLTGSRGTEGIGLFAADAAVGVRTRVRHASVYLADYLDVTPRVTLSGSARYTHSVVELRDQLGSALDGDHRFSRLNPAAGATFRLAGGASLYASYSMASRVPTPSELSCADPEDPCRLPNAFVADPPLEQVTANTLEGGIRGRLRGVSWGAGLFRTINSNDIIFVSSGALTNEGHFQNVDRTERDGLEMNASGPLFARGAGPLGPATAAAWFGSYTFLRARTGTPLTLSSPNHPDAEEGEIAVPAGAALPLTPRHSARLGATLTHLRATIDITLAFTSSQFLRGDEANLLAPIDASTVVNITGHYALTNRLSLSIRAANLFNTRYETFGLLGEADDVLGDDFDDPRFLSPGQPRAVWAGITLGLR